MRKLKCMVDTKPFSSKPNGYETGAIQKRLPDCPFKGTASELYDKILNGCTVMLSYFSSEKSDTGAVEVDSFEGIDFVAVDIDNEFSIKVQGNTTIKIKTKGCYYLTPETVIQKLKSYNIYNVGLIYHTFSSEDVEKNNPIKFRVIIPLTKTITHKDEASKVLESFAKLFTVDGVQLADCKAAHKINSLMFGARKENGCIIRDDSATIDSAVIIEAAIDIDPTNTTYLKIKDDLDFIETLVTPETLKTMIDDDKIKVKAIKTSTTVKEAAESNNPIVEAIKNKDADTVRKYIFESAQKSHQDWVHDHLHNKPLIHYSTTTSNSKTKLLLEYEGDNIEEPETLDLSRLNSDLRAKLRHYPLPVFLGLTTSNDKNQYSLHCILHNDHNPSASIKHYEDNELAL